MSNQGERFRRDFKRRSYRIPRYNRNDIEPRGQCAHCNCWTLRKDLREQEDYRGGQVPVGLGFFVCPRCYFKPNPQGALQTLPPDPEVVLLPWPNTVDFSFTPPTYAWPLLPNPSLYLTGLQITVTGLEADPVICYADGDTWRNYDTDAVVEFVVLLPQTQALTAQMVVQPTTERLVAINAFMGALLGSVFPVSDIIYALAAADSQTADLNWAAPGSFTLSPSACVLTPDVGYSQGISSAMDSGLPANAATHFKQTDASMSWYNNGAGLSVSPEIGFTNALSNTAGIGANGSPSASFSGLIGGTTPQFITTAVLNPSLYCLSRSGTTLTFFQNGVSLGTRTMTNQTLPSTTLKMLQGGSCPFPMAYARFGGAVTAAQAAAEYAGLAAYLAAL